VSALDGPISDQALDRLRITAAMVVAIPQMAVQVRTEEAICLEVRRTPAPGATHRVIPPCAFHRAVAGAVAMRRSGERVGMRGVPPGVEPAVDWGVTPCARLLPGGIVRVDRADGWLHLGPVLGDECHLADALAASPGLLARRDETLGVTIVHGTTPRGDKVASRAIVDALIAVMGRVGVADLEQRLGGQVQPTPERRAWR
jgi:hypothetical protein